MSACTGAQEQYTTNAVCLGVCAAFPRGAPGDTSGDSLACRAHYAVGAATSPATQCGAAGPSGGDLNTTDTAPGPCGTGCAAFCDVALTACTGASVVFADLPSCLSACASFRAGAGYSTSDTGQNDYGCRLYHASIAASSLTQAPIFCPHIASNSVTCVQ
jgi:hypothetical protein